MTFATPRISSHNALKDAVPTLWHLLWLFVSPLQRGGTCAAHGINAKNVWFFNIDFFEQLSQCLWCWVLLPLLLPLDLPDFAGNPGTALLTCFLLRLAFRHIMLLKMQ